MGWGGVSIVDRLLLYHEKGKYAAKPPPGVHHQQPPHFQLCARANNIPVYNHRRSSLGYVPPLPLYKRVAPGESVAADVLAPTEEAERSVRLTTIIVPSS